MLGCFSMKANVHVSASTRSHSLRAADPASHLQRNWSFRVSVIPTTAGEVKEQSPPASEHSGNAPRHERHTRADVKV